MLIRLGYELVFQVPARTPMVLMLYTHPSRAAVAPPAATGSTSSPTPPCGSSPTPSATAAAGSSPRPASCGCGTRPSSRIAASPTRSAACAPQQPVEELPPEVLPFLLGSRYCEVDRLTDVAWSLFGQTPLGWPRVQAVCDWVHTNVQFGYQFANPSKSAWDVYHERTGVCRDFNHLALTFCRCLGIPARYATGYLGDIGVPCSPAPMDFSGWFEAYLGGRWHTFDARHNTPRIGRVVMARGRDAVDVAMTTSFGPTTLEKFTVYTDEVPEPQLAWRRSSQADVRCY